MSEYDNGTSQAQHSHGKQRLKRCVLRRLRKTGVDCADMTCCGIDCSRHEQQQPEKLGHRRLITAYDGWLAMTTRRNVIDVVPRNPPAHGVRQQDTTVLLPAYTLDLYRQGERACSQSSPPPLNNEVRNGAEWCSRISVTGTPAGSQSSSPTGDTSAGTAEYRQGLHFRDPAVTKRMTLPATEVIGNCTWHARALRHIRALMSLHADNVRQLAFTTAVHWYMACQPALG